MDDDLFQFEPPKEAAPELVLGKKKKKKKKKGNPSDASSSTAAAPSLGDDNLANEALPILDLGTKLKQKKKKGVSLDLPDLSDDDGTKNISSTADDNKNEDIVPELDFGAKKKKKKKKADSTNGYAPDNSSVTGVPNDDGDDDAKNIRSLPSDEPSSAFSALSLDDDVGDDAEPAVEMSSKKKKKKKGLVLEDPVDETLSLGPTASHMDIYNEVEESNRPITAADKKKAKKERDRLLKLEKKKQEEDELAAILAEIGDGPSENQEATVSEPSAPMEEDVQQMGTLVLSAAQKKRIKKKKKAAAADDVDAMFVEMTESAAAPAASGGGDVDVNDLLAELEGGGEDTAASSKNKKKKKKKKGGGGGADDDVDALLAELEGGGDAQQANVSEAGPSSAAVENDGTGGLDVDDLLAELGGGGGGDATTAASKKKAKKKKKKGGAKTEDADGGEDAAPTSSEGGGKKKKKESAAVRMMREAQERMAAEKERLRKLKEEEDARIEEEENKREEEAKKKEEEKARKKAAEKAKKERKRQDGTLLTKAERERRRKAEAFKKQLMEKGMIPDALKGNIGEGSQQQEDRNRKNRSQQEDTQAVIKEEERKGDEGDSERSVKVEEGSEKKEEINKEKKEEVPAPPKLLDDWDAEEDAEGKEEPKEEVGKAENKGTASTSKPATKPRAKTNNDEGEDDDDGSDDESEDSDDDSDDSEYEGMSKAEIATEKRVESFRKMRSKQKQQALAARTADKLRSPVICILGHVDTGKTKILDKIRRTNVQDGEAGGITQQIGATYFPIDAVKKEATKLQEGRELSYNVPSLLIIDTPGHESFTNLRSRGSSLCDIAILVVDIMHGLEPQTRESIDLLKLRKTPFIVALNKIDRIYDWHAQPHNCPSRDTLEKQPNHAREEFHRRVRETKLQFAEIGFNTELYWENDDVRKNVSLVPTSAISGEGIPDLLMLLLSLPQRLLTERLMFKSILEATVLEVKVIEGLGTTIDVILTGGTIRESDTIVVVGLDGPLTATIRALLTPHPMKEMRVKGQYLHHKEIEAAQGVKISADGLEKAVAGTQLMIVEDPNNELEMEYVLDEVMQDFQTILTNVDKSGLGVYVQASTLGSLEALLEFLKTSKIPVSGINIGPVHKKDVTKASIMLERRKEFATILAFDVIVEREAKELAEEAGVRIFTADIIYHLFDKFTAYMEDVKKLRRESVNDDVVFPSISKILPQHIYNKKDPIVVGVDVMEGILRVGTPLVVNKGGQWLDIGRVASLELNKKQVMTAKKGDSVALKIQHRSTEHIMYGRHFDFQDSLVSKMSRNAIDLLKESFKEDLATEDWRLVVKLKKMFGIL